MKAEIGLFSIAILLLLHVAASHSLVRGFAVVEEDIRGISACTASAVYAATQQRVPTTRGHCRRCIKHMLCSFEECRIEREKKTRKDVGEIERSTPARCRLLPTK